MKTKNQISITRKALYGVMLLGLFFSIFGVGNLPSARAQEGEPVTPTPEVQVPVLQYQKFNTRAGYSNARSSGAGYSNARSSNARAGYSSTWTRGTNCRWGAGRPG